MKPILHRIAGSVATLLFILSIGSSAMAQEPLGIIDTHEHIESLAQAEDLMKAMDATGIDRMVLVASPQETLTLKGADFTAVHENEERILEIAKTHPERFFAFCSLDPREEDKVAKLESCVARGGVGLKLYNGHSVFYPRFDMKLDDPAMEPVYAYADEQRLPVLMHVNLASYGDELRNVLKAHPNLILSVPHFMVSSQQLSQVEELMAQYPNLYTDISFGFEPFMATGFRYISSKAKRFREFAQKFPDRILFGADLVMTSIDRKDQHYMERMLGCYRDLLMKETFSCRAVSAFYQKEAAKLQKQFSRCKPSSGQFCQGKLKKAMLYRKYASDTRKLNGFGLTGEALEKALFKNAQTFLNLKNGHRD